MKKEKKIQKLNNLKQMAKQLDDVVNSIVKEACEITGEDNEAGFTFDFILNNYGTAEELVKRFK